MLTELFTKPYRDITKYVCHVPIATLPSVHEHVEHGNCMNSKHGLQVPFKLVHGGLDGFY